MAGNFGSASDDDLISGINVTPLVDVVLVLLIIFMITAPVLYQAAIKVQLPHTKTGDAAQKSPLDFTLTKEGKLAWNKESLDWSVLATRLKALGPKLSDETATINADTDTSHGTVIRLMDALREAGMTRFALTVESSSTPNK